MRLLQCAGFVAAAILLYAGTFIVLSRWNTGNGPMVHQIADYYKYRGGNSLQRFREFDAKAKYDAVILGSSHAYRGYDPAVFAEQGYSVFNLGSSAQTPLNSLRLANTFLDSARTPLLILDVYEGTLSNDGLESTMDLVMNLPTFGEAADMAWAMRDLRGLNALALRTLSPSRASYPADPKYMALGFAPHRDSIKTMAGAPSGKLPVLDRRQKRCFKDLLDLCQERGIKVVVSSHFARSNRRAAYHVPLATYIKHTLSGSGMPYLDFTDAPHIDDRNWFADENHLNLTGADIFTRQLVDSLESLGYLHKPQ